MKINDLARALIVAAVLFVSRFLPHPWNFSPVLSLFLFSGFLFSKKPGFWLIPFASLFLSDIILGMHRSMIFIYIVYFAIFMSGRLLTKEKSRLACVPFMALSSSVLFFIFSNLGVWLLTPLYEMNLSGFLLCFEMAIPFFKHSLLGDLVYSVTIFGVYFAVQNRLKRPSFLSAP